MQTPKQRTLCQAQLPKISFTIWPKTMPRTTPCTRPRFLTMAEPVKFVRRTMLVPAMPPSYLGTRSLYPTTPMPKPRSSVATALSAKFRLSKVQTPSTSCAKTPGPGSAFGSESGFDLLRMRPPANSSMMCAQAERWKTNACGSASSSTYCMPSSSSLIMPERDRRRAPRDCAKATQRARSASLALSAISWMLLSSLSLTTPSMAVAMQVQTSASPASTRPLI
mmetsp:Transcript_42875/g.121192  ORF Transcript_42875/g.121192 Transcript_42875/m.121192 type:complete len:223 (-) Transcript_42875:1031-1699(-)